MIEYYVFDTEATATAAEAAICQIGQTPIVGINAATGLPEPEKQKTERWAIPQQRLDGKWVFPVVPKTITDNYPQSVRDGFNLAFPNIIETYSETWFNPITEQ